VGDGAWAAPAAAFGGAARLAESDISSSRFGIWANTLALIAPALGRRGLRQLQPGLDADAARPARRPSSTMRTTCRCTWPWNSACRWRRWCWRCWLGAVAGLAAPRGDDGGARARR
jgi:hypothetical protein